MTPFYVSLAVDSENHKVLILGCELNKARARRDAESRCKGWPHEIFDLTLTGEAITLEMGTWLESQGLNETEARKTVISVLKKFVEIGREKFGKTRKKR